MRMKITALAILPIFSIFPGRAAAQKIEMKKGLRLVHNEKIGAWGVTPKVRLELVRTIGGLNVEDEHLAFKDPTDTAMDSKGCIYILDRGNARIQKLSSDGTFLQSIGRHGQGPAEFQFPFCLAISPDDKLFVMDYHNLRIQILTPEGKMERAIKFTNSQMSKIRLLKSGDLVLGGRIHLGELMRARKKPPDLLSIIDREGKALKSFGEFIDYGDLNVNSEVHWFELDVDHNDNIYVTFRYQNRIEKYFSDGTQSWRANRILNYGTAVIDKGYLRIENDGSKVSRGPWLNTVSNGISVDTKGRIWVITQKRQLTPEERGSMITSSGGIKRIKNPLNKATDIYKFEIFDSEGILLGEIPIAIRATALRIFGESLFMIGLEEASVYEYRIIEN